MLLPFFAALNAFLSFIANYVMRFSALDITPIAVMLAASQGDSMVVAAAVMLLAYNLISIKDFAYVWITFPAALLAGWLYTFIPSIIVVLLIYHAVGLASALTFGYFTGRYAMFIVVNFTLNYAIGKIVLLFM